MKKLNKKRSFLEASVEAYMAGCSNLCLTSCSCYAHCGSSPTAQTNMQTANHKTMNENRKNIFISAKVYG